VNIEEDEYSSASFGPENEEKEVSMELMKEDDSFWT